MSRRHPLSVSLRSSWGWEGMESAHTWMHIITDLGCSLRASPVPGMAASGGLKARLWSRTWVSLSFISDPEHVRALLQVSVSSPVKWD